MSFFVHDTAEVSENAKIGEGTNIWHQAQVRENTVIGKNCNLGKGVYIDEGVTIGDNVKIQNYTSVYKGLTIGDDVFVGPHVTFTNDHRPRACTKDFKIFATKIEDGASIGANSTIICGITIGENAMIGAGSVVTKDVPPHALVYGNPAKLKGYVCLCGEKLSITNDVDEALTVSCGCGKETTIEK